MHKILLLNDTIISQNYGCQLVSYSLRKALTKFFPDSNIDFYSYKQTFNDYDKDYDLVIITTNHDKYNYKNIHKYSKNIIDCRGIYKNYKFENKIFFV